MNGLGERLKTVTAPFRFSEQHFRRLPIARKQNDPAARVKGHEHPHFVCSRIVEGWNRMVYQRINVELVIFADEADSVVAELNSAIDRLEEAHTIFGGGIEVVAVQHSGTRRKSALMRTLAAGGAAAAAIKLAGDKVAAAYKKVI
jgi:hypothetical protein